MLIKVTEEDIAAGKDNDGDSCPIALACKREIKEAIRVSHSAIYFPYTFNDATPFVPDIDRVCWLPKTAIGFIQLFDNGLKVDPFEFEIEYPPLSRPPGTK